MSQCADNGDEFEGINSPTGMGNDATGRQAETSAEYARRVFDEEINRRMRETDEAFASSYADNAGPSAERPTAGDTRSARGIARGFRKIWDSAKARSQVRLDQLNEAVRIASGTTVGESTLWNNIQNKAYRWFVNQRADMYKFFNLYARQEGKQAYQNTFSQEFDQLPRRIRGQLEIFNQRILAFKRSLLADSRSTGHSVEDLAQMVGTYATARHAPEVNALLINRWSQRADELVADWRSRQKKGQPEDSRAMRALLYEANGLRERAKRLSENLETVAPREEIMSAGYTNADARLVQERIIRDSGLTREQLEAYSDRLGEEFKFILEERAKRGAVSAEVIASFPDFQYYVPMFSRGQNLSKATNDAAIYNPGSYYALEGRTAPPDDAFSALAFYAQRAATEIGTQNIGLQFAGLERSFIERYREEAWNNLSASERAEAEKKWGKDARDRVARNEAVRRTGLRSISYNSLVGMRNSNSPTIRDRADGIMEAGGIVVDVPRRDAEGNLTNERRYYWFDSDWKDEKNGLTGPALNEALSSNYKLGTALETIQAATGFYGQSFTRFQPAFAPVAGMRDIMERAFHMTNRDYQDANGNTIAGTKLLGSYFRNMPRATKMLYDAMRGKAEEGSAATLYWAEYNNEGLNQKFTPGMRQEPRTLEELLNPKQNKIQQWLDQPNAKWAKDFASRTGETGRQALQILDGWNDWCQNIAGFSQYITMREAGIPANRAGQGVLELMNMSQQGSVAQYLGVISPFVRPTTQSALALARTLGLGANSPKEIFEAGKRGWMTGLGAFIAYSTLAPVIRESLGYDENGNSYADSMSIGQLTSSLPIGLGDGRYIKFPSGFGPQRIAAALAWGMDRMRRGLMEPGDAAFEVLFAAGKDIVPGNMPQFAFKDKPVEYVLNSICPAPLTPFLQLGENINFFGSPIHGDEDPDKLRSAQGRTSTPRIWHNAARWLQQTFGMDVFPESLQFTAKSLKVGPLNVFASLMTNLADSDSLRKNGNVPTALEEMTPWLGALGGALWYGKQRSAVQPMYYNARKELTDKVKATGINLRNKELKGEDLQEWKRQRLTANSDLTPEEIDDFLLLQTTEGKIRQASSEFNAAYKDRWMDNEDSQELRDAFEALAARSEELQNEFLTQYQGGRQ